MKKYLLIIYALVFSPFCFAQNCIEVTAAAFTGSGSSWNLNVNYAANGKKALQVIVKCGGTEILNTCFETNGSGSTSFTGLNCAGGIDALTATLTPHTGNCTSASCGPDFTIPPSGGPLPVNMGAFYAKRKNNSVSLSWKTETEINTKEFILQRKVGNGFLDVATIAAQNSPTGSFYSFLDVNSFKGVSQYRLKIIDMDGTFSYSEIRAVKGTAATSDFTVFPNPSRGNAKVTITDISEPTDVQLIDNSGRMLKTVSMNNSNTADFSNLQRGMYMIRIINKNSGETLTKKLNVIE
jgi:hypothetical protein